MSVQSAAPVDLFLSDLTAGQTNCVSLLHASRLLAADSNKHQRVSVYSPYSPQPTVRSRKHVEHSDSGFRSSSGLQHVSGDAGRLYPAAQRRPAGLALRPAHSAAEEDGGRPAGLRPG